MRILSTTLNLLNEIELAEGELTPEVELKIKSLSSQVDQAGEFYKRSENMIKFYESQIDSMKNLISRFERVNEYIKQSAKDSIALTGSDLKGDVYSFSLKKNPPRVNIKDESIISDYFKNKKEVVTVDKKRIKEAFDNGMEVDGAEMVQEYSVRLNFNTKKQIEE